MQCTSSNLKITVLETPAEARALFLMAYSVLMTNDEDQAAKTKAEDDTFWAQDRPYPVTNAQDTAHTSRMIHRIMRRNEGTELEEILRKEIAWALLEYREPKERFVQCRTYNRQLIVITEAY